ncbi:MAG: A/G-specific adenine glycosylase [Vulcanimicrobiaceae bacterium]
MTVRPIATALSHWFERHGRSSLPWRTDRAAYRVVVAEFMLQQTQVDRVVPLFEAFVGRWPSFAPLADASQADVVRAWAGLGYNSRAIRLHRLARTVREHYGGHLPEDEATLRSLPGIGAYTARAIRAFAFDADVVALDTNIRRIVHRTHFGLEWPPLASVPELDSVASALVPRGGGYAFNSALMDLGATLCSARAPKCLLCPLQASCAAAPIDAGALARAAARYAPVRPPQARLPFEATTRYVRGRVIERLRALGPGEAITLPTLARELDAQLVPAHREPAAFAAIVAGLERDGFVERTADRIRLGA